MKLEKNRILFRQDDECRYFYGVISGIISLRIKYKKDNVNSNAPPSLSHSFKNRRSSIKIEQYDDEEKEILRKYPGSCFGETGLIYTGIKRTATAFALTDCVLFSIQKAPFLQCFGKSFIRSEIEKKNFIISHIPGFKKMKTKFDFYYRQIVPIVFSFFKSLGISIR